MVDFVDVKFGKLLLVWREFAIMRQSLKVVIFSSEGVSYP
jgi:hypothetical protein